MFLYGFFSCWNVQMILNVSCKSGHVRLCCLRTFKSLLAFSRSIVNQRFISKNSLTNWSIPLTTLSMSTSISNFKTQIQIRKHFCLMVCWRSWQHDTDFRGYEVELWPPILWNQINSTQILTMQAPEANEIL